MLYEALLARPPFVAAGPGELMAMHIYKAPLRPQRRDPSIPADLDSLIVAMLAKRPVERPTMQQVAQRLTQVIGQLQARSSSAGRLARLSAYQLRRMAALGLAFAGLAGALYLGVRVSRRAPASAMRTRAQADAFRVPPEPASDAPPAAMVYLPGGRFTMGSTAEEVDAAYEFCRRLSGDLCQRAFYERELPSRPLTLSPYYLDATEVTSEQFAAWLNRQRGLRVESGRLVLDGALLLADLYPAYGYSGLLYEPGATASPDMGQGRQGSADRSADVAESGGQFRARPGLAQKPIVQVTWHAALRYCQARDARLPTEAEWEFAARGRRGYRFPWGDDEPLCEGVVFGRLRGEACANAGVGPAAVGHATQDRTPEGVRDLGGNVSEWVLDSLQVPYPLCSPSCRDPVQLPTEATAELTAPRVVRGGNWYQAAESCRGAGRSRLPGNQVKGNIGFRCARSVNP